MNDATSVDRRLLAMTVSSRLWYRTGNPGTSPTFRFQLQLLMR